MRSFRLPLALLPALVSAAAGLVSAQSLADGGKLKSGVQLANGSATVSDDNTHFDPTLTKDDLAGFEGGAPQELRQGSNQKKAIMVISDGNDTISRTSVTQLLSMIRESEVMVYALGVDGNDVQTYTPQPRQPSGPRFPIPIPRGGRGRWPGFPIAPQI